MGAMFAIMTTLIGAMLGLRFKVLILVPAIVTSFLAIFGIGIAHGVGLWASLLATLLTITTLQIGYLAGAAVRFGVARARARKNPVGIIAVE